MTIPSLLLGLVIPIGFGALFHLWKNGGAGHLLLYIVTGEVGFWLGHLVAGWLNIRFGEIGALHAGPALIFSLGVLLLAHWVTTGGPTTSGS